MDMKITPLRQAHLPKFCFEDQRKRKRAPVQEEGQGGQGQATQAEGLLALAAKEGQGAAEPEEAAEFMSPQKQARRATTSLVPQSTETPTS